MPLSRTCSSISLEGRCAMSESAPAIGGFTGRRLRDQPLWQLARARIVGFLREPEAVFWTFMFPILMALALGIAFRNQGPQRVRVGLEEGPGAAKIAAALGRNAEIELLRFTPAESDAELRRGKVAVLVRPSGEAPPHL